MTFEHQDSAVKIVSDISQLDVSNGLWLFGYGSLIFKPPLYYDLSVPGYIKGYVRRFWQSSNDHRGTPESPGRVVTLISKDFWQTLDDPHPAAEDDTTWGVAYRIPPENIEKARQYLDFREKNGYSTIVVDMHVGNPHDPITEGMSKQGVIPCLVYIGTPENEAFVGPEEPRRLAEKILASKGPSGENREYLFKLGEALLELTPEAHDHHIEELMKICRNIEGHEK